MNQIINLHHFTDLGAVTTQVGEDWRYQGRPSPSRGLQGSPLANSFPITSSVNRERAIARYRHWLWEQITAGNQEILDELCMIGPETTLACWCAPKHCHCAVIARAARWLRESQAHAHSTSQPAVRHKKPPLPTRFAPGQFVGDTNFFCERHTHATLKVFVRRGVETFAHRLDSGLWCLTEAHTTYVPTSPAHAAESAATHGRRIAGDEKGVCEPYRAPR